MRHWLSCKKYSPEIADELAKDYALNLQQAFAKGYAMGSMAQNGDLSHADNALRQKENSDGK